MSKLQKTDAIVNIILFIKENIQSVLGVIPIPQINTALRSKFPFCRRGGTKCRGSVGNQYSDYPRNIISDRLPTLPRLFLLSQKNPPLLKKGNLDRSAVFIYVNGITTFSCCSFFVYYFDNYLIEIISIISFLILLCLLGLLDYRNNSRIVNQQNISVFKNNKYDSLRHC